MCKGGLSNVLESMFIKDMIMKRNIFSVHFTETRMILMILLVTSTALIPLGLNQNQIANAQQLQGIHNNLTPSLSLAKQQQPNGTSFQMDNTTFSHHTTSVNGIKLR